MKSVWFPIKKNLIPQISYFDTLAVILMENVEHKVYGICRQHWVVHEKLENEQR